MFFFPPCSLQRFWSRHFWFPHPQPMQRRPRDRGKWYALLNEVRVLCSLLESERPGTANPKGGGISHPCLVVFFLLGGFRKREKKKDGTSWKMVGGIWIWIAFFGCCFQLVLLFWGGKRRMARPTAFFGGWFLNYRLSMIDDVCVSQGPLNKQRMRYSSSNFS